MPDATLVSTRTQGLEVTGDGIPEASRKLTRDKDGLKLVEVMYFRWSDLLDPDDPDSSLLLSTFFYYQVHPIYTAFVLKLAEAEQWMGSIAKVTLNWGTPDYGAGDGGVPPPEFNETASSFQTSVQENANFSDVTKFPLNQWVDTNGFPGGPPVDVPAPGARTGIFDKFLSSSPEVGTSGWYHGGLSVTHVVYGTSRPSRSATVRIADPPDSAYASSGDGGQWLRLTSEVNKSGTYWARRDTYLFSEKPWSVNGYDS